MINVYYINGCAFLRTIACHLMFRTSMPLRNSDADTLFQKISVLSGLYKVRGFQVVQIFGDNQFTCLQAKLRDKLQITFEPCSPGAHEPFIERDNRTSKERCRCVYASLPYKRLPKRMILELPSAVDFYLNYWCSSGGVSD